MSRSRERVMLFALAITIAIVAIEVRVVAGRTWDDVRYHTEIAPPRLAAATQIHAATLPRWWDGAGLGVPLLAEPSHGAAYPPLWLATSPRALDLVLVAHLAWLAIGLALWARRCATDLAAGGAAILVATSGIVAAALLGGALPALAHVPWVGFTASGLARVERRRCRARYALALAGCLALIALAGQLAVLVDALALACVLAARRTTWRWLVIAVAAALAIGCIQWLPALAVHGVGSEVDGLPLARLVELVVPAHAGSGWSATLFVGTPLLALALVAAFTPARVGPAARGDASGGADSTLGRATRDGACAGRLRGIVLLAIVLAILALVVGRGGWPAVLGAPELHLAVLAMFAGVAAARGIDKLAVLGAHGWPKRHRGSRSTQGGNVVVEITGDRAERVSGPTEARTVVRVLIGAAVATLVVTVAAGLARGQSSGYGRAVIDGTLCVGCVVVAAITARVKLLAVVVLVVPSVAAMHATAPTTSRAAIDRPAWVDAALAHTDPTPADRSGTRTDGTRTTPDRGGSSDAAPTARDRGGSSDAAPTAPDRGGAGSTAPDHARADAARAAPDRANGSDAPAASDRRNVGPETRGALPLRLYRPDRLDGIADDELDGAIGTLVGTSATRWGIARANSNDPARLAVEDRLWTAASHGGGALLDRFGVSLAVLPAVVAGGGFAELGRRGTWSLVRYPAVPIAAVYGNWMFLADERATFGQLFPAQGMQGVGRGRVVLVGAGTPSEEADMTPQACVIASWDPGAIELSCTASEDAYAVVSSAARDGWTATVDGRDTPWVVADVVRRAIALSAGTHAVSWRYRAPLLALALVIAALGLVVLAVVGWLARR